MFCVVCCDRAERSRAEQSRLLKCSAVVTLLFFTMSSRPISFLFPAIALPSSSFYFHLLTHLHLHLSLSCSLLDSLTRTRTHTRVTEKVITADCCNPYLLLSLPCIFDEFIEALEGAERPLELVLAYFFLCSVSAPKGQKRDTFLSLPIILRTSPSTSIHYLTNSLQTSATITFAPSRRSIVAPT